MTLPLAPILTIVTFCGVILLSEALVLQWLRWGTFRRSLLASLLVNTVSTLTVVPLSGFLVAQLIFQFQVWPLLLVGLLCVVGSIALEGGLLLLVFKRPALQTWKAAFLMNVMSYVLLIATVPLITYAIERFLR